MLTLFFGFVRLLQQRQGKILTSSSTQGPPESQAGTVLPLVPTQALSSPAPARSPERPTACEEPLYRAGGEDSPLSLLPQDQKGRYLAALALFPVDGKIQPDTHSPSSITCLTSCAGSGWAQALAPPLGANTCRMHLQANRGPQAQPLLYSKLESLCHSPLRPRAWLVRA